MTASAPAPRSVAARLAQFARLVRFSHTIFAMPFALLATVMATTQPLPGAAAVTLSGRSFAGILLCMVFARSVAMAFNRLVDRHFDADNPRTRTRHLPAGILGVGEVWLFLAFCSLGFVASTLLFLPNLLPLAAALPLLAFLCGYSLAKRFTAAAHLWLGVALALSPLCVWLALRGWVSPSDLLAPAILAVAITAWVSGFDIIYASQDADYDSRAGLHSAAARLGVQRALRLAAACHGVTVLTLLALPLLVPQLGLGWLWTITVVLVGGLLVYEHRLVSPDDLQRVNIAFFHVNSVISVALLLAGSIDCWLG